VEALIVKIKFVLPDCLEILISLLVVVVFENKNIRPVDPDEDDKFSQIENVIPVVV